MTLKRSCQAPHLLFMQVLKVALQCLKRTWNLLAVSSFWTKLQESFQKSSVVGNQRLYLLLMTTSHNIQHLKQAFAKMRSMLTLWLLKYTLATRAHNKILNLKYGVTLINTSSFSLTVRLKKKPSLCTLTQICKTMIPTTCRCPATKLVIQENITPYQEKDWHYMSRIHQLNLFLLDSGLSSVTLIITSRILISSNSSRSGNLCECGRKQLNKQIVQRLNAHSTRNYSFFRTTLDLTCLSIVVKWLRCSLALNLLMFAKMVMSKQLLSLLPHKW